MFAKGDIQEREKRPQLTRMMFFRRAPPHCEAQSARPTTSDKIKTPIMLVHGAQGPARADRTDAFPRQPLKDVGKQPEAIVVEDKEAHGFRDLKNNVNLYTKMLAFFDKYIGPKSATAQAAK